MLVMIHNNPARIEDGKFLIDRKFHVGMQRYVSLLEEPILTVHPQGNSLERTMDLICIPEEDLGYQVMTLETDRRGRPLAHESSRLRIAIAQSRLVYGYGFGCEQIARSMGIPYVLVLEYDLQTQLTMATAQAKNSLVKAVRAARVIGKFLGVDIPAIRHASGVHCNGYPIFDAIRRFAPHRLLYLDSRMSRDFVMDADALEQRLDKRRPDVPLRLIYSGRYEKVKGALDAVMVAEKCLRQGLNIEMHCYGQGAQRDEMHRVAASVTGGVARIHIHDAVPYPTLVALSKTFDVFVCCHIQGDPSCTYLESMGAGLPIVGYANAMWRRLSETSQVGFCSVVGRPQDVVDGISQLLSNNTLLAEMSRRARTFALDHTYEHEFQLRIDGLKAALNHPGNRGGRLV
jgi:colanic acid/amylovoran biosynthesis glycosyltransferase